LQHAEGELYLRGAATFSESPNDSGNAAQSRGVGYEAVMTLTQEPLENTLSDVKTTLFSDLNKYLT